jgi:hypothetical protein
MGQRANLILTMNQQTAIYYSHWRANTLPDDLFWGPKYAAGFIRSQQPGGNRRILDEIWAEGGAVLDFDAKKLLFFGGEDVMCEVALRRIHLSLMREVWSGWDVSWAYEGVVDLANYLGVPRETVLTNPNALEPVTLKPAAKSGMVINIVSLRSTRGTLRFFPLVGMLRQYLRVGPSLLATAGKYGMDAADLRSSSSSAPHAGFHIDEGSRTVDFWCAQDFPAAAERVAEWWPGWDVTWHRDRFEFQLERSDGLLQFPTKTEEQILEELRASLLRPPSTRSGAEMIMDIAKVLEKHGETITSINPDGLHDAELILSLEERTRIFEEAKVARRARLRGQ